MTTWPATETAGTSCNAGVGETLLAQDVVDDGGTTVTELSIESLTAGRRWFEWRDEQWNPTERTERLDPSVSVR